MREIRTDEWDGIGIAGEDDLDAPDLQTPPTQLSVPKKPKEGRSGHRCGDEAAWWSKLKIDPTTTARELWLNTHPLPFGREKEADEDATSPLAGSDRPKRKRDRVLSKDGANDETKPFVAADAP